MNKKAWIGLGIVSAAVLIVFSPIVYVIIVFPTYSSIALAIMFFLLGLLSIFSGIKQRSTITQAESSSAWWKNYFIMMGLAQESFGLLLLTVSPITKAHVNETTLTIIGVPVLILALGLGFYAIALIIRNIAANGKPS